MDEDLFEQARQIFLQYIQKKGYRKTPERFLILKEIFQTEGHFEVEELYERMKQKKYCISRATIYNNIELMIDCNLVIRHDFGQGAAKYEKSLSTINHHHLICLDCGKIFEFHDPRISDILKDTEKKYNFKIQSSSLYIYGRCIEKDEKNNCVLKKTENTENEEN